MPNAIALKEIQSYIAQDHEDLLQLSKEIHAHPETAYQELFASQKQGEYLQKHSSGKYQANYTGLTTAYRMDAGSGGPVFAFCAEYDALPGIGHGCGHNLICTAAIAAFCAVERYLKKHDLPGRIVLFGTPGEESGGGKVKMIDKGMLEGIDGAMMVHPNSTTKCDLGSSAICRYIVRFKGKSAHAAASPELGLNALDAVLLLFQAVNAWRQQLPESSRVHGVVSSGGVVPNIIPEDAECVFFLRAMSEKWINIMRKRFFDMVRGAELMTGCTATVTERGIPYQSRIPNMPMNHDYIECAKALGMEIENAKAPGRGSSDFGNVSQRVPGIHAYFGISHEKIPAHSEEFAAAACSEYGFEQMFKAAAAMAHVALRFLADEEFRTEVTTAFNNRDAEK